MTIDPPEDDLDGLCGWTSDKADAVIKAIETLTAAVKDCSFATYMEIPMRITMLRYAAELPVPPKLVAEAKAYFEKKEERP